MPEPKKKVFRKKVLRPLTRDYKQVHRVFGFDIETAGDKNDFVCAVITDGVTTKYYTSREHLIHDLNSQFFEKCIIIATNLSFDFLGVFYEQTSEYRMAERNGRIYNFKLPNKALFLDTLNYFPASVEELGHLVDIEKLPHPPCFSRRPQNRQEWSELFAYCKNDALISCEWYKRFVLEYFRQNKLKVTNTIASIALNTFRKKYLTRSYTIEKRWQHDIAFKSYFGGRTEILKRGRFSDVNYFDINSMYPFCLLNEFPDPDSVEHTKIGSLHYIETYMGVSYIEGVMPDQYVPPLPVRYDEKIVFPCGKIKGYYTHIDIMYAREHGLVITAIGECLFYTKTCRPFAGFVSDMYEKRLKQKEQNDPMQLMTKLNMNSLYGKFGFDYRTTNEIKHVSQVTYKDIMRATKVIEYGDFFELQYESHTPTSYSVPIWSSYTTSYARILLHNTLKQFEKSVIYCDTDSMFLHGVEMPSSSRLGDFKKENTHGVLNDCLFIRPKFYYAEKPKIKGVQKLKDDEKSPRELFDELVQKKRVDQYIFTKFRTVVKSKEHHKRGRLQINERIPFPKTFDLEDKKRQWSQPFDINGQQDSRPLNLDDAAYETTMPESLPCIIIQ